MNAVPWLRVAAPYRDEEIEQLKRAGYTELRSMLGSAPLRVSEVLESIGCSAIRMVAEDKRKALTVTVCVVGPDTRSMSTDGFKITPRGKITPLYTDEYDD